MIEPAVVAVGLFSLIAGALAAAEACARILGFHRPVLYEKTEYGYRIQPSQNLLILGKRNYYNVLGLRSAEFSTNPSTDTIRVLCIGDSITNGGSRVDQQDTYPCKLNKLLSEVQAGVEVLNISASGWALENELNWLRRFGVLGSQWVVQQVATHDLHQDFATNDVVDANPNFPAANPSSAIAYLFNRFIRPRLLQVGSTNDPGVDAVSREKEDLDRSLSHLASILSLVRSSKANLMIVLVEQPARFEPTDSYAQTAKKELSIWAQMNAVPLVLTASALSVGPGHERNFRDVIHPNERGNQILAECVFAELRHRIAQESALP